MLLIYLALAVCQRVQATLHVVAVGQDGLTFVPEDIVAQAGDFVQFQFHAKNHSVVQSTFAQPCLRKGLNNASVALGLYSGFMPTLANATVLPTYTVMINNTEPIWLYCGQAKHCQSGMVMAINPPQVGNTLAKFKASALNNGSLFNNSNATLVSTPGHISTSERVAEATSVTKTVEATSRADRTSESRKDSILVAVLVLSTFFAFLL